jgi:protein-S-isoprenylcysteine O-methyltransferase Ste14
VRPGPLPPTYFLLTLLLVAVLHVVLPIHRFAALPLALLGLGPVLAGVGLNLTADRAFKRAGTPVSPFDPPTVLVTTFPFSISRNPMYLGFTLLLLGIAILLGTVGALLPVVIFLFVIDRRFIALEERSMAAAFGATWMAYAATVRRWI